MFFGLDVDYYLLFFEEERTVSMSRNWENLNKNNFKKNGKNCQQNWGGYIPPIPPPPPGRPPPPPPPGRTDHEHRGNWQSE